MLVRLTFSKGIRRTYNQKIKKKYYIKLQKEKRKMKPLSSIVPIKRIDFLKFESKSDNDNDVSIRAQPLLVLGLQVQPNRIECVP